MPDQQNETPGNSTGSHPSDRNKDVRWMGHSSSPVGRQRRWETDKKQKCQINKTKRQEIPRAPTHRTETKTSDGWGTVHPQWVGNDGGRPIRSKNARSTKRNARKFHGLPPIGQKQRRPMDGAQFIPRGSATTVGDR